MRAVESPKNDFFAPRPKLSRDLKLLRAGAFLTAVVISILFFVEDWVIIGHQQFVTAPLMPSSRIEELLCIIKLTLVQVALVLPCWRAWLFKRWACLYILMVWFGFPLWLALIPETLMPVEIIFVGLPAFLVSLTFAFLQFMLLIGEWQKLKSGF